MGLTISTTMICGCDRRNEKENNSIQIMERLKDNHVDYIFRCTTCGKLIYISVRILYNDALPLGLRLK
jgi:hypothetical protein